jgi:hypothetical protein
VCDVWVKSLREVKCWNEFLVKSRWCPSEAWVIPALHFSSDDNVQTLQQTTHTLFHVFLFFSGGGGVCRSGKYAGKWYDSILASFKLFGHGKRPGTHRNDSRVRTASNSCPILLFAAPVFFWQSQEDARRKIIEMYLWISLFAATRCDFVKNWCQPPP